MPKKNVLLPVKIASGQSLAASFVTTPTVVDYTDNIAYQINATTSSSAGTFTVQGSLDYVANSPMTAPGVAGNWSDLVLSGVPTLIGASDTILINLNQVPFKALRIKYNSTTAGSGTCDIYIEAKGLA